MVNVRKHVYKFYKNNITLGKMFTYNHFKVENVPKTTVYCIIKRYESGLTAENKKILKRKGTKMTKSKVNQFAAYFDNNPKAAIKKGAKKFKILTTHIHRLLKTNIKYCHRESLVKRPEQQNAVTHPKCGCLFKKYFKKNFILDGDYFTLSNSTVVGNDEYYSSDPKNASPNLK